MKSRPDFLPSAEPSAARVAFWILVAASVTLALWVVRDALDKVHVALVFLLVVLAGSARDGRLVGLLLSVICFLTFNFFLLPPLYALQLADPLDWGVLLAFLITGGVAAELLHRQRLAARLAERRAGEMDRLAGLAAESLSVARAIEAVEAITEVIQVELGVETCELYGFWRIPSDDLGSRRSLEVDLLSLVEQEGRCVLVRTGRPPLIAPPEAAVADVLAGGQDLLQVFVPLVVRDRILGVLHLADKRGLRFEPPRARFAATLAYYAALAAERVRLEAETENVEALREADRLKDALLATVSHDLRTPLTTIRAAASELREAGAEQGELIEVEADRLNSMVADLLDLSRLRAGRLPLSMDLNAAEDLVGAALQRLSGLPGAEDITVRLPTDGTILVGRFDFVHSLRALTNLVENALRHASRPDSVEIRVLRRDELLLFEVVDDGPGVPAGNEAHVFQPFFRSDEAGAGRGAGLGLAIARRVAEAQGGSVVYRPHPAGGSVFTLELPATDLQPFLES